MHFLRLLRPINLLIVALTMYGLGWYFDQASGEYGITSLPFFMLVISTVMIAAAGNIINDYFDVRADRINKPDRLIIGKHVKKRVAIVSHWAINFVAFSIAIYLSWKLNSFWYLFIHLFSINILWYYSLHFKRRFLIGNVLIAALTALVPVLVGIYFFQVHTMQNPGREVELFPIGHFNSPMIIPVLATILAVFAFLLNLAREVVKDMEDVKGDKLLSAKTLPIMLGYPKSKAFIIVTLFLCMLSALSIWLLVDSLTPLTLLPIILSALLSVTCVFLIPKSKTKKEFKRINNLIKLAMTTGLLTPVYWKLLEMYG